MAFYPDPRQLGRYFALAQVGLEMAAPIVVGAILDHYLDWAPWGVVVGAVLGLIAGLTHLVNLSNRPENEEKPPDKRPP